MEWESFWGLSIIAGPVLLGLALAYALIIRPRRRRRLPETPDRDV